MTPRLVCLIGLLSWTAMNPQGSAEAQSAPGEDRIASESTTPPPQWWSRNQEAHASGVVPRPDEDGGFTVLGRPALDQIEARRSAETAAREVLTRWLDAQGRSDLAAWTLPDEAWRAVIREQALRELPNDPDSLVYAEAPHLIRVGFRLDLSSGMLARLEQAHAQWRSERQWARLGGLLGFLALGFALHRLANRADDLTRGYFSLPVRALWLVATLICGAVIVRFLS